MARNNVNQIREEIKLLAQLKKSQKLLTDAQKKELDALREQLKAIIGINKKLTENVGIQKNIVTLSKQITQGVLSRNKFDKETADLAKRQLTFEKKLLTQSTLIGSSKFERVDLSREEKRLIEDIADIEKRYWGKSAKAGKEMIGNLRARYAAQKNLADVQEQLHISAEEHVEKISEQVDNLENMIRGLPGGDFVAGLLPFDKIKETMSKGFTEGIQEAIGSGFLKEAGAEMAGGIGRQLISDDMMEVLRKFAGKVGRVFSTVWGAAKAHPILAGLTIGFLAFMKSAVGLANELGFGYDQISQMPLALIIAGDEARALMDEFGGLKTLSSKHLLTMKLTNWQYGVSAEAQAKILGLAEATSGMTRSQLLSQIRVTSELARAAGVAPQAVMEDIAQNTELFAKYGKDGGKNIAEAAIFARKLGMELSDIAGISESLLDWESSIQAEMEAELLLGRQLNLEKARQLNFSGDLAGMAEEIKNQVGSEAEFNKMNLVQRQALAGALGMNVEQMSKMIREQEHSNKSLDKSRLLWIAIATVVGGIIGMVIAGLTGGSGLALALPAMSAGTVAGAAIGASLAGIGTAIAVSDIVLPPGGAKAITGPAGTFALNKNDTVVAGTNLGGNTGEMKELVKLTKQMLEQNKMLMTKLDRSVRGLAAV